MSGRLTDSYGAVRKLRNSSGVMAFNRLAIFGLIWLGWLSSSAAAGAWDRRTNEQMAYHIYTPSPIGSERSSLMINLHGCAQKAVDLKNSGNWVATAEKYNMVVAIPEVPAGGVVFGCWDYYGTDHNVSNRHHGEVISLIESLLRDPGLRINPRAIYISGLSSGGGEAALIGCLRPDLIAGIGLSSTPALGSTIDEIRGRPAKSPSDMKEFCESLAGTNKKFLATQVVAIINSDQDYILNTSHSLLNRDMYIQQLNLVKEWAVDTASLPGSRPDGEAYFFSNPSGQAGMAFLINSQLGHNWPAGGNSSVGYLGSGTFGSGFISQSSVDFPAFMGEFFEKNSIR